MMMIYRPAISPNQHLSSAVPISMAMQAGSEINKVAPSLLQVFAAALPNLFGGNKGSNAPSPVEIQLAQKNLEYQKQRDEKNSQLVKLAIFAVVAIILVTLIIKMR